MASSLISPEITSGSKPVMKQLDAVSTPHFPATVINSALNRWFANAWLKTGEAILLICSVWTLRKITRTLEKSLQLRKMYFGRASSQKLAYVDGKLYWGYHCPGWPSRAFARYLQNTINRIEPFKKRKDALHMAFIAITKKCPLACEHCFEWDNLNKREKLTLADLKQIVGKLQDKEIAQIHFSGGEPMLRVHDMIEVMQNAKPGTDFWVITSGYLFTAENACQLKQAGLTGVSISLDHYIPNLHNAFRHFDQAFDNAIAAVGNAHKAKLVVNLSLCVTREMATEQHLMQYTSLAKKLGAAFIQLVEPRAVGHFANQSVELSQTQLDVLHTFYEKLNFDPAYANWPIVTFHGYHQRSAGCSGAGNRFLYIDTDGDIHACPFCQKKNGNVLQQSLETCIADLRSTGCHVFDNALE